MGKSSEVDGSARTTRCEKFYRDVVDEDEDESQTTLALVCGNSATNKRTSPKLLSLLSYCLIFTRSDLSLLYSFGHEDASIVAEIDVNAPFCSSIPNEVLMDSQNGGGKSLIETIKIAFLPIAKVFTVCFLGFLLAYFKLLLANGRKLLNGLVFSLLLPCLIFSQLGQAITLEKMIEWVVNRSTYCVHRPSTIPILQVYYHTIWNRLFSMVHAWVWAWQLLELLMKISMTTSEAVNFIRNQLRQHGDVQLVRHLEEQLWTDVHKIMSTSSLLIWAMHLYALRGQIGKVCLVQKENFVYELGQAFATIGIVSLGVWISSLLSA
ncbi:hypothetical protein ACSBR2_014066 [Camellia fascicularis]